MSWVIVYKTIDPQEAQIIRIALVQNDIEVIIENEELLNSPAPSWSTFAPLHIQVPSSKFSQAKDIVQKFLNKKSNQSSTLSATRTLQCILVLFFIIAIGRAIQLPTRKQQVASKQVISKEVLMLLCEGLKDKDVKVRRRTAFIINNMGAKAQAALPKLQKALDDKDLVVKFYVICAIGNMGKKAISAIPHLKKIAQEQDKLEEVVIETIEKIQKGGNSSRSEKTTQERIRLLLKSKARSKEKN